MSTYSIAISLFLYNKENKYVVDPIEAIRSVGASRFRETELMAEGIGWEIGAPDPKLYREILGASGVFARTIHAPYQAINLASFDESERIFGVKMVSQAMRFLAEIGGETIIVHPTSVPIGSTLPYYTLGNVGKATENAHRSIAQLATIAQVEGVSIALENLPARGMSARPLQNMQELRSFIADLPQPTVGICHDIGHSRLINLDIGDEARIASDRLLALHLQDGHTNDDDHLPPGHGILNFDLYGKVLDDIGFEGARTLEVLIKNHPGNIEDVVTEVTSIREKWETDGMSNIDKP